MPYANLSDLIIDLTILLIVIVGGPISLYRERQKFNLFYGNILIGCGLVLLVVSAMVMIYNNEFNSSGDILNILLLKSDNGYRTTQVTFVFFSYIFLYLGLSVWVIKFLKKER